MRPAQQPGDNCEFSISLPERPDLGSLKALCNSSESRLSRPQDWNSALPIPEGLYLLSPMQVAQRTLEGQPDWSTQTPLYYDLVPTHHRMQRLSRCWRLCGPGQPQSSYDICLQSVSDLLRLYEWSLTAPLDLLAVDHGLGVGWRASVDDWLPLTRMRQHPARRARTSYVP